MLNEHSWKLDYNQTRLPKLWSTSLRRTSAPFIQSYSSPCLGEQTTVGMMTISILILIQWDGHYFDSLFKLIFYSWQIENSFSTFSPLATQPLRSSMTKIVGQGMLGYHSYGGQVIVGHLYLIQ